MLRAVISLVGLVSFATLLAEGIAVGVLAYRGQLSSEAIESIAAVLAGRAPVTIVAASEPSPAARAVPPSAEEMDAARTVRTLELNARADDLRLLKQMLAAEADQLAKDRAAYDQARRTFEARLAEVRARAEEDATEQTRLVVKAMPPREAVLYLLSVPEQDALRIVRGLPERTTAKILQEFAAGTDEERQRGESLFEAISAGRPDSELTDAARAALPEQPANDAGA
jgi:flagellar motility protein MotE (MotC chaperone)